MMSNHRMLPLPSVSVEPTPGLDPGMVAILRRTLPARLTPEFERLLRAMCGFATTTAQAGELTDREFARESSPVVRPSLTLAVDDKGRRWIAETVTTAGIPGPVWCVYDNPRVVVYVSADVREFVDMVLQQGEQHALSGWLQSLDLAAERTWQRRGTLAFQSRQHCSQDPCVRPWLLQLPRDARVYDLRSASFGDAWPYGAAGTGGRLHRCERELLFAVSGFPPPSRWADHLAHVALTEDVPVAAVIALARDRGALVNAGLRSTG